MSQHSFSEFGQNSGLVAELYELFLRDPNLVEGHWAEYFRTRPLNGSVPAPVVAALNGQAKGGSASSTASLELQARVSRLIRAFRDQGHRKARVNPLSRGVIRPEVGPDLQLEAYKFSAADLGKDFFCDQLSGQSQMSLRDIVERLEAFYCGSIGFEYNHVSSHEERDWLRSKIEQGNFSTGKEQRKYLLKRAIETEEFENQLFKKYVGQKWFSVRGAETLIPLLDACLARAIDLGVKSSVMGMAHRGRLAVLAFIAGKPLEKIFDEFDDLALYSVIGSGDTKYHKGYSHPYSLADGREIDVTLAPNPSHLEAVDPVVEGWARAIQDVEFSRNRRAVLPLLIHGEAAFSGQGVVTELFNFSKVPGYRTGGTLHIVVNNQVGFTTTGEDGRSSLYPTDFAKGIEAPVFHVNYEDVDACAWVAALATEYRQKFEKDVVIDLVCFRRFGHNEADDPSFTQPLMYSEITERKTVGTLYAEKLVAEGLLTHSETVEMRSNYAALWNQIHSGRARKPLAPASAIHGRLHIPVESTKVSAKRLETVVQSLTQFPEGFDPHPKLKQLAEKRVASVKEGKAIDWGTGEALAFGSLVQEGVSVRLSGQDCGRGTFTQRHLQYADRSKPGSFWPLSCVAAQGAHFEVFNSTLSENAVLGFEFGYAAHAKQALVLWEAQFGDFVNGAQIIIDQFISASEAKWDQLSGVVLMLPHGYEGMGSEHSSCRFERFLQLCAENNMTVAYPSSSAQHFHLLRRQALSQIKRPLVIMTPKSLLRLPDAASPLDDFSAGKFEEVLPVVVGKGKHLVICTGKVFHDLNARLKSEPKADATLLRLEQLYPFPESALKKVVGSKQFSSTIWLQEEPKNMGAFFFVEPRFRELGLSVRYVGRPEYASPATGSLRRHQTEQAQLLSEVVGIVTR